MAVTLDSVLNAIIPPAVAIFVVFIVLYPFREPLGKLWSRITEWRSNKEESYEDSFVKSVTYE